MRALLLAPLLALVACAPGATIDGAYGRPDATTWTYFEGSARDVVDAISRYYTFQDVRTESVRSEGGGLVLTLASRRGGAGLAQILVQPTTVEGFESRAQLYPVGRPLPRDLEDGVTREL